MTRMKDTLVRSLSFCVVSLTYKQVLVFGDCHTGSSSKSFDTQYLVAFAFVIVAGQPTMLLSLIT